MPTPLIPCPAYDDVARAVEFLVEAFGFTIHARYDDDSGVPVHVELALGEAMVMPAAAGRGEYGSLLGQVGGTNLPTTGFYVVVDDVDAHHERARAARADVITGPGAPDHGGRQYTCRDIAGHLWTFGTYDPWATND